MKKQIRLNEDQLVELIKNIAEECWVIQEEKHYNQRIEMFVNDAIRQILEPIERGIFQCKFNIMVGVGEFVKSLDVFLYGDDGDITDQNNYEAAYESNNTDFSQEDRKLVNGKIDIFFPVSNGYTKLNFIAFAIEHELTHLYDDYTYRNSTLDRENKKKPEERKPVVPIGTTNNKIKEINYLRDSDDDGQVNSLKTKIPSCFPDLAYMQIQTEKQAHLQTVFRDLALHGASESNIHSKSRQTTTYNNVNKAYRDCLSFLDNSNYTDLLLMNNDVREHYPSTGIPYYRQKFFDGDKYRKKLRTWADNIYKDFLTRYDALVQDYYDNKRWNNYDFNGKTFHNKNLTMEMVAENKRFDHTFNLNLQII